MGYENLYSIGRGGAQVWGTNVGLSYLQQTFDQDRKRREKDELDLQAQVSKIDISKVRQPDQEDAYAMYDNVKTLFRQYQNTTNKQERRRLESEMDNAKREVQDFVGLSQTTAQRELELYKVRMGAKAKMHKDYAPNYLALTSARIADPSYKTLAEKATGSIYAAEFDEDKKLKTWEARAVEQVNDPKIYTRKVNGGTQTYRMEGTKVNTEKLSTQIIEEAKTDEGLRDRIAERNPDLSFAEATKEYIKYTQELLESKNKVKETGLTGFAKDDNYYAHALFADKLARQREKEKDDAPENYEVSDKTYRFGTTYKDGKPIQGQSNPLATIHNSVTVVGNKSFAPTQLAHVYNLKTGKDVQFDPTGDAVTVSRVGYITVKGGRKELRVTVIDKTGQEYAFQEKEIPIEIRTSNGFKKALQASVQAQQGGGQKTATNNSSSTTKIVTYVVDGTEYNIPSDKVGAFLKAKPKAKKK